MPIESQFKAEKREGDGVALHNESALGKVEGVLDKVTTAAGDATRRLADYSVNEKNNPVLRAGAAVLGAITSLGDEQTIGKTALVVAAGGVALLAAPAIAAALTPEAAAAGGASAAAVAQRANRLAEATRAIDPNKLHHIFDKAEHNLGQLVETFGSQERAYHAVYNATQAAVRSQGLTGTFKTTVEVAGQQVIVKGAMIENVVHIGTFRTP